MPRIRPGHVNAVRGVTLWMIRAIAAFLVLYGVYLILARVVFSFFGGGLSSLSVHMRVGEDHGIVRGVPMFLIGITLVLTSRKLVRWIVAVPDAGCPGCRYAGTVSGGRCPECGLEGLEPIAGGAPDQPGG